MPDIIVIGASAGGLAAVSAVVKGFPRDLPAVVFVTIHTSPESPALLADILDRAGNLPAVTVRGAMPFEHGHIYVAPPDAHLLVDDGYVRLSRGPREHRFRPAIDPLFRTAAARFGNRVIGVVLSGNLGDGTHGLMVIKEAGGTAIVQDPREALAPGMPESALQQVDADHVLSASDIGLVLTDLVMQWTQSTAAQEPPETGEDAQQSDTKKC
jgi:two-component system chemotaxis response regulator CheB